MTAIPLEAGSKLAEVVSKAVNGDLVVIRGQHFRKVVVEPARKKTKKHPASKEVAVLVPIDYEVHVNPAGLGLAALATGAAALAGVIAWNGIHVGVLGIGDVTIFPGIKDSDRVKAYLANRDARKRCEAAGGIWNAATGVCTIPSNQSCSDLCALYRDARRAKNYTDARRFALEMQAKGCPPCPYP